MMRYGAEPEPWHSPQKTGASSPIASTGQLAGFVSFKAAESDAWSGASCSMRSLVRAVSNCSFKRYPDACPTAMENRYSGWTAAANQTDAAQIPVRLVIAEWL